jgi:hypothetical protein
LQESIRRLITDVGEDVVLPTAARAQRENALSRRASGEDREVEIALHIRRRSFHGHAPLIGKPARNVKGEAQDAALAARSIAR